MPNKVYTAVTTSVGRAVPQKLKPLWEHPAGPQTIFFWAPTFKWCLSLAGAGDFGRPAEKLSLPQSSALALTGLIWSRYSMVITPKNWNLFAVNISLATIGIYQLSKIYRYRKALEAAESKPQ